MYMGTAVVRRGPLYYKMLERERSLQIEEERQEAIRQEAIARHRAMMEARKQQEDHEAALRMEAEAYRRRAAIRVPLVYPTMNSAFEEAARRAGVRLTDILSDKRRKDIVYARMLGIYVAYRLCNNSMPSVGAMVKRDHTTVLHAIRKITALLDGGCQKTSMDVRAVSDRVIARHGSELRYWGA